VQRERKCVAFELLICRRLVQEIYGYSLNFIQTQACLNKGHG